MRIERLAAAIAGVALALAATQAGAQIFGPKYESLTFPEASTRLTDSQVARLLGVPAEDLRKRMNGVLADRPDDVAAHALRGFADAQLGQAEAALADLEFALAAGVPDKRTRSTLLELRSETLLDLHRDAEALVAADEAVGLEEQSGTPPYARLTRGWARLRNQQIAGAIEDLGAAVQRDPRDPVSLYRLATAFDEAGNTAQANITFAKGIDVDPNDIVSRWGYADFLLRIGDLGGAQVQADAAMRLAPRASEVWVLQASIKLQKSRLDEALADADRAVELAGQSDGTSVESVAALVLRSRIHLAAGRLSNARADVERAVEMSPEDASAHNRYAVILATGGEHAKAIGQDSEAIRLEPSSTYAWLHRGIEYEAVNDRAAAIMDFTQVITQATGAFARTARIHRAASEAAIGRNTEATADLAWLDQDQTPLTAAQRLSEGVDWYQGGDLARAAAAYRLASSIAPGDPVSRKYLAVVLEAQHDFAGAADAYAQSLAIERNEAVTNSLARMQVFTGHFALALPVLEAGVAAPHPLAYAPLWLFVARVRANPADEPAARAELAKNAPPHEPRAWTDSLADFLGGRVDARALRQEADSASPDKRAGHQCEADYYTAELLLAHHDAVGARPLLEEATRVCPSTFYEAKAAIAELGLQSAPVAAR